MYLLSVICYPSVCLINKGCSVFAESIGEWVRMNGNKRVFEIEVCLWVYWLCLLVSCDPHWLPHVINWAKGSYSLNPFFKISTAFTRLSWFTSSKIIEPAMLWPIWSSINSRGNLRDLETIENKSPAPLHTASSDLPKEDAPVLYTVLPCKNIIHYVFTCIYS